MNKKVYLKRILCLGLTLCMLLGMAGCFDKNGLPKTEADYNELGIQALEGLDAEDIEGMTEEEKTELTDKLIEELSLKTSEKEEEAYGQEKEGINKEGELEKPFDEIYPEVMEKGEVEYAEDTLLIKLKGNKITQGLKEAGVLALTEIVPMEKASWYEAHLKVSADTKEALEAVRKLPEVLMAEYNFEIKTASDFDAATAEALSGNPYLEEQWYMKEGGIPEAYASLENKGGNEGVIVAVIDTGVDYNHEDLAGNIWKNTLETPGNNIDDDGNGYVDDYYGIDLIFGQGSANDDNGHGTHVAGIIAAQNNNIGTVGIAYNTKIMPIKAATHSGTLTQGDIARGITYAYEMGAQVINMSFGGSTASVAVQDALATAYTRCVLVASAGNSGLANEVYPGSMPNYPAALSYVIGVMSCNESAVESGFTNWDVVASSGLEYDVYAPGENIMSTLPNNRYGLLSGTSMAAPVVSAYAAVLRSEQPDITAMPTKLIYGQLVSTSDSGVTCLDPKAHLQHNIPNKADLYTALMEVPTPEISLQDYRVFDLPKYSEKNNGDGVLDAGETVALGFMLRNRYGASSDTVVTIDTLINGISDPYIIIEKDTVNYGGIGTYSQGDCGRIYTDELFTDWQDPFLITLKEDCPNDYLFTINATITCKNALTDDEAVYTFNDHIELEARNGIILPNIIDEDMVLEKGRLYIIPRATVIEQGATVTVKEGVDLQFWSSDPKDSYSTHAIPYLLVNGTLLVEGTQEEPVNIFPSETKPYHPVVIAQTENGYVSYKYADIQNFAINSNITYNYLNTELMENCNITFNTNSAMYYRYFGSDGNIEEHCTPYSWTVGKIKRAVDCTFYKVGFGESAVELKGNFERCVFADCAFEDNTVPSSSSYKDCVFLGNSVTSSESYGDYTSHFSVKVSSDEDYTYGSEQIYTVFDPESGTAYAFSRRQYYPELLEKMGCTPLVIENEKEYNVLCGLMDYADAVHVEIKYDPKAGEYTWYDGRPIAEFLDPDGVLKEHLSDYSESVAGIHMGNSAGGCKISLDVITGYYVYEFKGYPLVEDISFCDYTVYTDLESTYCINPIGSPYFIPNSGYIYESENENIATVDETGLVTPVALGETIIKVYTKDRAVMNYITLKVTERVDIESLTLKEESLAVARGESVLLNYTLLPENTTRTDITYSSSEPEVATVAGGKIFAHKQGETQITLSVDGIEATLPVTVYERALKITPSTTAMVMPIASEGFELPEVYGNTGSDISISWSVLDESVAVVEDGKIVPKALGITDLIATDLYSGLTANVTLQVAQEDHGKIKKIVNIYNGIGVLYEDGTLASQANFANISTVFGKVTDIACHSNSFITACDDGYVKTGRIGLDGYSSHFNIENSYEIPGVITVGVYNQDYYALTEDGTLFVWGENENGKTGVGYSGQLSEPTVAAIENIAELFTNSDYSVFRTHDNKLYIAGEFYNQIISSPYLLAEDVKAIYSTNTSDYFCYQNLENDLYAYSNYLTRPYFKLDGEIAAQFDYIMPYGSGALYAVKDGRLYYNENNDSEGVFGTFNEVSGISGIDRFTYVLSKGIYASTKQGALLKDNNTGYIFTPMYGAPTEPLNIISSNLEGGVLKENKLTVSFNKMLSGVSYKLYAGDLQIAAASSFAGNTLTLTRAAGFEEGVEYRLEISSATPRYGKVSLDSVALSFIYEPVSLEEIGINKSVIDPTVERYISADTFIGLIEKYHTNSGIHSAFSGNAVLNPLSTNDNLEYWFRLMAPTVSAGKLEIPIADNYWGSANTDAIELQMVDYTDSPTYGHFLYSPFLAQAPYNTFPFAVSVEVLNKDGEVIKTAGSELITVRVTFNRPMNTEIPLNVLFGSAYPYGDYEIEGQYVSETVWEGRINLGSTAENGYQFFKISNGESKEDSLKLMTDSGRFGFHIDTTAAQALLMQGSAGDEGISLSWTQDDFTTLMGYNVYRSESEDGYYTRLNSTVIPAETKEFFDSSVLPGKQYYYNFTVVQTDLTESEPSGKIAIMSKDTMAPNIYHSGISTATEGRSLVVSATVTDNLQISYAELLYRVGENGQWKTVRMNNLNDKFSAIIPANDVTAEGLEYYILAYDGVSYTYRGSEAEPYRVQVGQSVAQSELGDINIDGKINIYDALLLLYSINDKYNMTAEEFARADLDANGILEAKEALRILQYSNGSVGSVDMR